MFTHHFFQNIEELLQFKHASLRVLSTLDDIECGETQPEKQQHANATITTKINKEDCYINFNKSAKQVKCLILGANPDPIATTRLGKDLVKIYRARVAYDLPDSGFQCDRCQ